MFQSASCKLQKREFVKTVTFNVSASLFYLNYKVVCINL